MPDGDVWTVQMNALMCVEAICCWNCNKLTFRSKVLMFLGEDKYCNPKIVYFSVYHIRILEYVVASFQKCKGLYDAVALDFSLACLCQTDIAKVINVIFWRYSGTQN
jgi:hypothetical protein